jgi:hypothetical protein
MGTFSSGFYNIGVHFFLKLLPITADNQNGILFLMMGKPHGKCH